MFKIRTNLMAEYLQLQVQVLSFLRRVADSPKLCPRSSKRNIYCIAPEGPYSLLRGGGTPCPDRPPKETVIRDNAKTSSDYCLAGQVCGKGKKTSAKVK